MAIQSMEVDRDVSVYLQKAKASAPADLKDFFSKFEELYDKKLWHQLTLLLATFAAVPSAAPFLVPVYDEFVVDWVKKMNQLSLVQYVAKASRTIKDPKQALAFVSAHVDRLHDQTDNRPAYVLAAMEAAHMKLLTADLDGCKALIDACEKILDEQAGTEPIVNASFYRVSADYYKAKAQYPQYYHNALLFLSSIQLSELSTAEKAERAYDLALSALLGDGLYNFGELLMHPILDTLTGSPADWLRQLLFCFNAGDNAAFEKLSKHPEFLKRPLLVASLPFLTQKLCLMSLMESVFRRSKEERGGLTFAAVSRDTRVALPEVEHLVMKALSLGLIKGSMDEIDQTVSITWVQPRVLDMAQVETIKDRLSEWAGLVKSKVVALESSEAAEDLMLH